MTDQMDRAHSAGLPGEEPLHCTHCGTVVDEYEAEECCVGGMLLCRACADACMEEHEDDERS